MERDGRRPSAVWAHFKKKDAFTASCNFCNNDYSYRTSVSNLRKHLKVKHGDFTDLTDMSSDSSDSEQEISNDKKANPTWKYFNILDSDKFVANCKLCDSDVPYESVSDLTRHVQEHGETTRESGDEEVQIKKSTRKVSPVWQYFKVVDAEQRTAACVVCKRVLSYCGTISNLKKHVVRLHPEIKIEDRTKKIIISSNGLLYEVETSPSKELPEEKDPMEMDTVYLEDLDDLEQMTTKEIRTTTPKKKPMPMPFKRKKIPKEQVPVSPNTSSDEEEIRSKRKPAKEKISLDYFAKYIVCLMQELPKQVCDQLQGDIIKQIMATKLAHEPSPMPQTPSNYCITISDTMKKSNSSTSDPVTVIMNRTEPESSTATENTTDDSKVDIETVIISR